MRWWARLRRVGRERWRPSDDELVEYIRSVDRHLQQAVEPPTAERVAEIVAAMRAEPTAEAPRRRHRRRRRIFGAGVAVLLVGGGAVTWALRNRESAPDPAMVSCHLDTRLDGSQIVVSADGRTAIEICREVWERGSPPEIPPQEPPDLVGCVGPGGQAAVFPGQSDEQCGALGLDVLALEITPEQVTIIEFEEAFVARIRDRGCLDVDEVVAIATEELGRAGLDWEIVVDNEATDEKPCAIVGFDPANERVNVENVEDFFPGGGSAPSQSTAVSAEEET